jgi:hypothetical protein
MSDCLMQLFIETDGDDLFHLYHDPETAHFRFGVNPSRQNKEPGCGAW